MANEISTSVLVNEQEAQSGTVLELPLPDGRSTSVTIPAGVRNGQVLQFPAHIPSVQEGEPPDTLMLTVYVEQQGEQTEAVTSPPSGNQVPAAGAPSYPGEQPFSATTSVPPGYPPLPAQAAFPPQGGYPYASAAQPASQPPKRKQHIVRNVMIISTILVILLCSCAGIFVWSVNQLVATSKVKVAQTRQALVNAMATEQSDATQTVQIDQTGVAGITTATAANPNPYLPGVGTFLVQDKLDGTDTPNPLKTGTVCNYQGNALHIVSSVVGRVALCDLVDAPDLNGSHALFPTYQDFTVEFKMTILRGDTGGIHFRTGGGEGYRLDFDSRGACHLWFYQNGKLHNLFDDSCPAFQQGFNQENTIGLVVQKRSIIWFVNGQKQGTVTDSTVSDAGGISLETGSYINHTYATEVAFHDFKLWTMDS